MHTIDSYKLKHIRNAKMSIVEEKNELSTILDTSRKHSYYHVLFKMY